MFDPKHSLVNSTVCRKCSDFDFLIGKSTNRFLPPKDYPNKDFMENEHIDGNIKAPVGRETANKLTDGHLYPLRITYETLSQGLRYALFNYLNRDWEKKRNSCVFEAVRNEGQYYK